MNLRTLIAAGAFACLSFSVQAAACENPFAKTVGEFMLAGAPVVIVDAADLPGIVEMVEAKEGKELGEVTRGFIVRAGDQIILGLEVDACLLPPIVVAQLMEPRLSGRGKDGKIGA